TAARNGPKAFRPQMNYLGHGLGCPAGLCRGQSPAFEVRMGCRKFVSLTVLALGIAFSAGRANAQTVPTNGPAKGGSPAWFLQGSFPDPAGRTDVDSGGLVTITPRSRAGSAPVTDNTPNCSHSTICGRRGGFARSALQRVEWKQTLGYTFTYPYD